MHRTKRIRNARDGNAAVEFAMLAPVLLLFVLGIFETGRLYFVRGSMRYAINEAARYAMVFATAQNSVIEQRVRDNLIGIPAASATPIVTDLVIGGINYKQISLSYNFDSIVGSFLPWPTIALNTQTSVPIIP